MIINDNELKDYKIEVDEYSGEIKIPGKVCMPGPYMYWPDGKITYDDGTEYTKFTNALMRKFTKSERSTWPYFWAHWCAFQMVAINLRVWKFKYLFHDWYKPWLKMFGVPYKKIQKFHKEHSNHHLEHLLLTSNPYKFDWESLIIDWECSQYTKEACPRNARDEMEYLITEHFDDKYLQYCLNIFMRPKLTQLGL